MAKRNTHGGGATTTKAGLGFERAMAVSNMLEARGFHIENHILYNAKNKRVGEDVSKHRIFAFLKFHGVNWQKVVAKRLIPDEAYFIDKTKTVVIFEKKFQSQAGSVDEKIQTGPYKKRYFERLIHCINPAWNVKYAYVCNDWFNQPRYDDEKEYLADFGCNLFIDNVPITKTGKVFSF